jgi:hypothetical protein
VVTKTGDDAVGQLLGMHGYSFTIKTFNREHKKFA